MYPKWSKKIVIRLIKMRHRNGQKLNSWHMQKKCNGLYQAGCRFCGSWKKAIRTAGIDYDSVRAPKRKAWIWSKEKVIACIQRRHQLGRPLNSNHMQKRESYIYGSACKYFGGWRQAVQAAGFDYSAIRKRPPVRQWSKESIVAEIHRRHERGLSIKGGDVCIRERGLYGAALRHFGKGAWARVRILAGFKPTDPRPWKKWDKDNIREEIVRLKKKGVPLDTHSMQKSPYAYIMSSATKIFGTWGKAIRAAGFDYSKIRKARMNWWTRPRIAMCIRNLERRGIRLSSKSIQRSHCALFGSAVHYFGCWSQAVEAAGISYQRHCRTWSTKAWLRKMRQAEYQNALERAKTHARKRRNA